MLKELIAEIKISGLAIQENINIFEAQYGFKVEDAPEFEYFKNIISFISDRDKAKIILEDALEQTIYLNQDSEEEQYNQFIGDCYDDTSIKVIITVNKIIKDHTLSVYAFDEFCNSLKLKSMEKIMFEFSGVYQEANEYIIFRLYEPIDCFSTKTMIFTDSDEIFLKEKFPRKKRLEKCGEVTYFQSVERIGLLPDDFNIVIDYDNNPLRSLFERLRTVLALCYLSNSVKMSNEKIEGVISGQRNFSYSYELDKISVNENIYKIYNWIHTDGSCIDKAIIARNIICLHCKQKSLDLLDEVSYASIESNYNLYLKDNVEQYIELKNKIGEFIAEVLSKTGEYSHYLLDKFKLNVIAIFGFLFTAVIGSAIDIESNNIIFTMEITVLIEIALLGSFIYVFICERQSKYQLEKLYHSYELLKNNYKDILSSQDIEDLFQQDKMMNDAKAIIKCDMKKYKIQWIIVLVVLILILEFLSDHSTLLRIVNLIMC